MLLRLMILAVFLVFCVVPAGYSQSLEEVIDNSRTSDCPVATSVSEAGKNDAVIKGFSEILMVSPMGLPSIERLLAFIRLILREIVVGIREIDMNVDKPPLVKGNGNGGEGIKDLPTGGSGSGSAFMKRTEGMNPAQREQEILNEILAGNIPSFLKNFKEIEVSRKLKDGKVHSIKYKVMPDYLAIGSDTDFVRMPMSPLAAQVIAEKLGCILPTTQMVDDIYKKAETQLLPQPMSGGQFKNWQSRMMKNEFYVEHQRLVESQCQKVGHQNGMLVAGHKKDVVISNHLDSHSKNVVIYGWHDARNGGKPIQGYGWSHENTYSDYSHGIRLISTEAIVDGKPMNIKDALADKVLCDLLSKEGPVKNTSARR